MTRKDLDRLSRRVAAGLGMLVYSAVLAAAIADYFEIGNLLGTCLFIWLYKAWSEDVYEQLDVLDSREDGAKLEKVLGD